jgi:type IV pilus assembly protein PilE
MRSRAAFTLVEMMVVLAILLVLAALVYPNYAATIVKSHRVQAQAALMQTMQDQERYYSLHNTYITFSSSSTDEDARRFRWWLGARAETSAYELSGHPCSDRPLQACIELRAEPGTPRVNPSFRDPECEMLTLNSAGERGAGGRRAGCWP